MNHSEEFSESHFEIISQHFIQFLGMEERLQAVQDIHDLVSSAPVHVRKESSSINAYY